MLKAALCASLFLLSGNLLAAPPTDPKALAIYNHDKEWLKGFPASFIATNIRGEGMQYAERRQAALDLLREKRDFGSVSELMDELNRNSFLSADICDVLGEWHSRRALPLLKEVEADPQRPKAVREAARKAIASMQAPEPPPPPGAR